MAAVAQKRIVHKQFNSPIGLYSDTNIKATLDRDLKMLSNGAVGIAFENSEDKPACLANSAVLRYLEEEEAAKAKGLKKVAWPPHQSSPARTLVQQQQQPHQPSPQYQQPPQQNQYQPQATQAFQPVAAPQQQYHQPGVQQQQQQYQPVQQQKSTETYQRREEEEYNYLQQQYDNYSQGSPGYITLRDSAPISQKPAPVFAAQPATQSYGGGSTMRGDQKWPPEGVQTQAELENEARRRLAAGPTCRPRRANKDYSQFFAQHALNSTYPGYRAPPGTQHFSTQY